MLSLLREVIYERRTEARDWARTGRDAHKATSPPVPGPGGDPGPRGRGLKTVERGSEGRGLKTDHMRISPILKFPEPVSPLVPGT